ncbi:hypothetical protein IMG5_179500 [Ichthyophthirius multifiliis]|uniref:Uncharacterized protein n=1 Tax=Ichthyophthirius multifiliis TaxID=5932 RepID=G0R2M9_ICHMU|nr:hypothetical protein IMG5_179500 [Ichthyophthirius multifiliis]EGR28293.1 hypothetical protein IMG5_179500 [Ichthyophthirius multifiliis]|eukprot:XP_004027638.1 hypothetical protein IMG5_179500 [Ichthyophthirius multifiliis]
MRIKQKTQKIIQQNQNHKQKKILQKQQQLQKQINDCKSTLSFWNTGKLNNQELKCLLIIFEKLKFELRSIVQEYDEYNNTVQNKKENVQQLKDIFLDIEETQIQTAHDYQNAEAFSINREYYQNRTRDVHYRNQPVKSIKNYANGIVKQIGYDIDQDFPVEVLKIPKYIYINLIQFKCKLNSLNAYKELVFSKFFPNYIGFNNIADSLYNLYFVEFTKGISLKKIIKQGKNRLNPGMSLFRYWMREIFLAFKDILHKTTYVPQLPIKLKKIFVYNKLKVYMKNIDFPQLRRQAIHSHEKLEATLLRNFGLILIQILGVQENEIDILSKYIEFKNFIEAILLAEEDLEQFLKKEVLQRLTFENLLRHHLLDEQYLLEVDELSLVEDYEHIFNEDNEN